MSFAVCEKCRNVFQRDEEWKKLCISCWKEKKRAEGTFQPKSSIESQIDYYRSIAKRYEEEAHFYRSVATELQDKLIRQNSNHHNSSIIEQIQQRLKPLLFFCHPDRNAEVKQKEATEITQWLMQFKR